MSRKRKAMADDDAGMIAGPGQGPALLSSKKRRVTRGDNDDDDDKATADQATRIVVEQAKERKPSKTSRAHDGGDRKAGKTASAKKTNKKQDPKPKPSVAPRLPSFISVCRYAGAEMVQWTPQIVPSILPPGVSFDPACLSAQECKRLFGLASQLPFEHLDVRGKKFLRGKVMFVEVKQVAAAVTTPAGSAGEERKNVTVGSLYRFPLGNDQKQKVAFTALADAPSWLLELRDRHAPGANNLIVQVFPDHKAGIAPHSDNRAKAYADLVPGKPIVDLILLQKPTDKRPLTYQRDDAPGRYWSIEAGNGAKVVLDYDANRQGQHAVLPVGKRLCAGSRISIVFRWIQSYFDTATGEPVAIKDA